MARVTAIFHGHVQGVGFRWSVAEIAKRHAGIHGFVRNEEDGSVRVEAAHDDAEKLAALIEEIKRRWESNLSRVDVHRRVEAGPEAHTDGSHELGAGFVIER